MIFVFVEKMCKLLYKYNLPHLCGITFCSCVKCFGVCYRHKVSTCSCICQCFDLWHSHWTEEARPWFPAFSPSVNITWKTLIHLFLKQKRRYTVPTVLVNRWRNGQLDNIALGVSQQIVWQSSRIWGRTRTGCTTWQVSVFPFYVSHNITYAKLESQP